jgi:hypothetical protein
VRALSSQKYALWKAGGNMKKETILQKIERAWTELQESYAGLTEAQMQQAGVVENWSVKDILAHVTTWEEEALKHLPHIIEGVRPPRYSVLYGGLDAFNAQMTARKQELSLREVLDQMDSVHERFLDYLQDAPEALFTTETRFRRRIRLDTYGHYPVHTQAIRDWRDTLA